MVKLVTSIIAASALVFSASALDSVSVEGALNAASIFEEVASLEASDAFVAEESASAAWEVEPVAEEEEDSGLSLMAQLSNYIQNLIHPDSKEEEAEEMDVNEATQQKKAKRMIGSAKTRQQLNKRDDPPSKGYKGKDGLWHYPLKPKSKVPGQAEASVAPEIEELDFELELPEQEIQNSAEMEAFPPFFHPHINPLLIGALIPEKVKKEIASKVKEKVEEAAETNSKLKDSLEKASSLFGKATKAIEDFKEKHKKTESHSGSESASATPTA